MPLLYFYYKLEEQRKKASITKDKWLRERRDDDGFYVEIIQIETKTKIINCGSNYFIHFKNEKRWTATIIT